MAKIVVSRFELAAAAIFASTNPERYVLNSVLIEYPKRSPYPRLVAVDGRRLAVIKSRAEQRDEGDGTRLLIRLDYAKLFVSFSKACGLKHLPWLCLEQTAGGQGVCVSVVGGTSHMVHEGGCFIDGDFPDWEKVCPDKHERRRRATSAAARDLGLNSQLVGDYAKAAKHLDSNPTVQMSVVGSADAIEVLLSGYSDFYSVIMPCRLDTVQDYQKEFVDLVDSLPKPPQDDGDESEGGEP